MRDLDNLVEPFQSKVKLLLAKAKASGLPVFVTDVTRTREEQAKLVAEGKSFTMNSKHLTGEAVDIAFLEDEKLSYKAEYYDRLYEITKDIPYVRWPYKDYGWNWDKPHHEYDRNKEMDDTLSMKEREKYEATIRQLNTEIGRTITERDNAQKQLEEMIEREKASYQKWQAAIEKKNKLKARLKQCKDERLQGMSLLEILKWKLGL